MRTRFDILAGLRSARVVAVVRGVPEAAALPLTRALVEGGIGAIEITCNTPGAVAMIRTLAQLDLPDVLVGAGTVLDEAAATAVILAGAQFLVAPGLDRRVIEAAHRWGRVAIPGALTPTEILAAAEAGADAIKLFPAASMGARYLREVRAPLGHLTFMVTGGISVANAAEFFAAGADMIGVGGSLVDRNLIEAGDWAAISRRAADLVRSTGA